MASLLQAGSTKAAPVLSLGADRPEQRGQLGALIVGGARTPSLPGRAVGELVFCPTISTGRGPCAIDVPNF
jgi:hypothetical protein